MNADAPAGTAQFSAVPAALRTKPQWLLWKSEPNGDKKPRKVPYYLSGKRRMGVQGDADDRAALAPFDAVCKKLSRGYYTGIGFAFLPGDGLIGIDLHHLPQHSDAPVHRNSASARRQFAGNNLQQRGFAHTIAANESRAFGAQCKIEI